MDAITTIATVPAIVALVNLLKKMGIAGKASLAAAIGLGVAINVANYYLATNGAYQAGVEGLMLGLGAAGLWDVANPTSKGDGWQLVTPTDNGLHPADPISQPSQAAIDMGAGDE